MRRAHGCDVRWCGVRRPHGCGVRREHGCGAREEHGLVWELGRSSGCVVKRELESGCGCEEEVWAWC